MSKLVIERLAAQFGERILETSDFRGDDVARVGVDSWLEVAKFLKNECGMNQFTDMTAVDYPEREPEEPRFDIVLCVRSLSTGQRVRLKTRVEDGKAVPSLFGVWAGTDWGEREIFDMFGIRFEGHPDLRRILLYEEFEGYPLRKDYPIEKTQPLIPYRDTTAHVAKLPPFGADEGQPFGRIQWQERLHGRDQQVSPAIAVQTGQRQSLSQSSAGESASGTEE
ncbi:MAG: NADH-quinone oxidoreductase subunit C [Myxococcales bacterium]